MEKPLNIINTSLEVLGSDKMYNYKIKYLKLLFHPNFYLCTKIH